MVRWIFFFFLLVAAAGRADALHQKFLSESQSWLRSETDEDAFFHRVLLSAMDSEALFTLACDLKPVSSGFVTVVDSSSGPSQATRRLRRALRAMRTNEQDAFVHSIGPFPGGTIYRLATVVNHRALNAKILEHLEFFFSIGVVPTMIAPVVLRRVEGASRADRFRGYGLLFGYPPVAVDFFVEADRIEQGTGHFVNRDAASIPVYRSGTGSFVWTVPVGHRTTLSERIIEKEAARILARYRGLRHRFAGARRQEALVLIAQMRWTESVTLLPCATALLAASH